MVKLKDITRIHNVSGFLKPEEARPLSIFGDFATEYQIHNLDELKVRIQEELSIPGLPESLEYQKDEWEKLKKDFDRHWNYMIQMLSRIPRDALTQGPADNLFRTIYHIVMVDKPHKAVPLSLALEGDVSSKATVSAIQLATNSIWIIEESAAPYLKNTDNYFYLNLPDNVWQPFTDENVKIAFVKRYIKEKRYIEEIGPDVDLAYAVAIRLNITLKEAEELISKIK